MPFHRHEQAFQSSANYGERADAIKASPSSLLDFKPR